MSREKKLHAVERHCDPASSTPITGEPPAPPEWEPYLREEARVTVEWLALVRPPGVDCATLAELAALAQSQDAAEVLDVLMRVDALLDAGPGPAGLH